MDADMTRDDGLTSSQLFGVVVRGWRFILASTCLFALVATAVAFLMTPVYRAKTLLIANETNNRAGLLGGAMGQIGGLAGLAGLGFGGTRTATTEALAVLQSRQFIQEFIDGHNLMPKIFSDKWDINQNKWKRPQRAPTAWRAYKRFTEDIMDVSQDRKTELVTLVIDWRDREEAADWANELVDLVNDRMRERAITEADQTISYLQEELRRADTVEVRSAISSMLESQLKTKAGATVRKQYAFGVIDHAFAPDRDVVLRPHKAIYISVGIIVGLLLGVAIAFLIDGRAKQRANRI
jgi:uncharacterized protein involved in exopolysaccharide biosynthesis